MKAPAEKYYCPGKLDTFFSIWARAGSGASVETDGSPTVASRRRVDTKTSDTPKVEEESLGSTRDLV